MTFSEEVATTRAKMVEINAKASELWVMCLKLTNTIANGGWIEVNESEADEAYTVLRGELVELVGELPEALEG